MKTLRCLQLIILVALVSACGGVKKTTTEIPQPQWVKSRPLSSGHYVGIGWARKGPNVNQYQQAAKQNAQADLASDISVTISSNSVLHAFEYNLKLREDFTSTVKAETQQQLEGFELVDTWEDANNYWVYYRLSKAEYQRQKEVKRNNAVAIATDLLGKALDARNEGNLRLAIVQLIKALEPIKPYFSEPIAIDFRGTQIFLGNEIFQQLSATISSVEIMARNPVVRVKMGQSIPASQLEFEAKSRFAPVVSELPVVASYSEKPIRNNRKRTGSNGLASFDIDNVRSTKSFETLTVTLDVETILAEATSELLIRRLVSNFKPTGTEIRITIEKPTIAIESNETNLGERMAPGYAEEVIKRKAIEAGLIVIFNPGEADYTVQINAATRTAGENGAYKNVTLESTITLVNINGTELYKRNLGGLRGTHFDYQSAGIEAFKEFQRRVDVSVFREILEAINRK